jgi:DNA-binding CsgD family transcriptional regulator
MNNRERWIVTAILAGTALIIGIDILNDSSEGVRWWHLVAEGAVALAAIVGVFYLMRGSFKLRHSLADEKLTSAKLKTEADKWKGESKKYLEGLSLAIDSQLTGWKLTSSEKEVAFLLLKGLSLKEIADTRKTSERTARAQSVSIYSKSGLSGRSELSAFFLEDLLPPAE